MCTLCTLWSIDCLLLSYVDRSLAVLCIDCLNFYFDCNTLRFNLAQTISRQQCSTLVSLFFILTALLTSLVNGCWSMVNPIIDTIINPSQTPSTPLILNHLLTISLIICREYRRDTPPITTPVQHPNGSHRIVFSTAPVIKP